MLSRTSKLERLDDGLVADRDGVNLTENGEWLSVIVGFSLVDGCLLEKHPELSLGCLFFVVASIADCA